jgi:hypothetical protein
MRASLIGLFGMAAIFLQPGATVPASGAIAAEEGCIVTPVAYHVRRCPPVLALASAPGASSDVAEPTVTAIVEPMVTPTASPPEGCIKTEVAFHVRRCPIGF